MLMKQAKAVDNPEENLKEKETRREQIKELEHKQELEFIKQRNMLVKQKRERKQQNAVMQRVINRQLHYQKPAGTFSTMWQWLFSSWRSKSMPVYDELVREEVLRLLAEVGSEDGLFLVSKSINFPGDHEVCALDLPSHTSWLFASTGRHTTTSFGEGRMEGCATCVLLAILVSECWLCHRIFCLNLSISLPLSLYLLSVCSNQHSHFFIMMIVPCACAACVSLACLATAATHGEVLALKMEFDSPI